MAIKKTEFYSYFGASYDQLSAGIDASQYQAYVFMFLLLKYTPDSQVKLAYYLIKWDIKEWRLKW
jgi:hypothetical protein